MNDSAPTQPSQPSPKKAHARIRAVPLRETRFASHRTFRLPDFRPVHMAAKKLGVTSSEFIRDAVMEKASKTLLGSRRRSA